MGRIRRRDAASQRSPIILKPVLGVAATGIVAILLGKVLLAFLLPFIGVALGFFFVLAKIVVIGGLICLSVWLLRRWSRREEKPASV